MALQSTTPLAIITLQAAASQIVFSSIPVTYRDLVIVADVAIDANTDVGLRFDGDTGSNYSHVLMRAYNNETNTSTNTFDRIYWSQSSVTTGNRFTGTAQVVDYAMTNKHKTVLTRSVYVGGLGTFVETKVNRWASNSAVDTITLLPGSGSFTAGSTLALYGRIA